ncbi:MAG: hypothetical protein ASUL_08089 [Candidatus Aramenus sulfurataquae]|jgi:hypothetical protein|uniref:Uncharacterized protein n=2 Tax=Candidatus Aramenus sulfurataquae TaxID=1326980 RepID=W7KVW1_9CREN|nr:MAG: hypothetical protein ASUL_08089 [Candidatus Aramenus sulfurataquae]MCL7344563.1 hypothetical protein [Candidatus Aramenus sulfurataquae]
METPFYRYALMRNFIRECLEQEKISEFIEERFRTDPQMRERFCSEDREELKELVEDVVNYIAGKGKGREEEVLNALSSACRGNST